MLRGLSRGPAGCFRQEGQQGNKSEPRDGADFFLNIRGQPGTALVKFILLPSSTEGRS